MTATKTTHRRSYGTGSLYVRRDANGIETWYAKWRVGTRQIKRRVGPKRPSGARDGLTRAQAERELREMIDIVKVDPPVGQRLDLEQLARRYLAHSERAGRKRSTRQNIESEVRVHLLPFFAGKSIDSIRRQDVADLVATLEARRAPKTVRNVIATLSALYRFAIKRGWASSNPCDGVDLPATPDLEEIRWLDLDEVRALVGSVRPGIFCEIDRAMFLTAAMTGARKGELVALRWEDVDWQAARIRIRQNFVRGEFGTPKSRRSTRSIPMADEVAGALDRLYKGSRWQRDRDLVFAHPATGEPLAKANITRRMRRALEAAHLDTSHCFHDLRHTFGTRMAAAGVPIRTLQEWMGHRDFATTMRYADYAPNPREAEMVAVAFAQGQGTIRGTNLSES